MYDLGGVCSVAAGILAFQYVSKPLVYRRLGAVAQRWGRQNKKQCLSRAWKTLLDSMGAKTMGTGLHPQGLKEIQVGLPWSGNMNSTRLQLCTQGSGLTSVETSSELAQLRLWT